MPGVSADRVKQQPDDDKLRQLILYICERSEGDPGFGAVKLNKLLFLADFLAYLRYGQAVTGQEYQALRQGPAPRRMLPIMREMHEAGEIAVRERDFYGRRQRRAFALKEPDLSRFSAQEIDLVDRILHDWWGANAAQVSERSHQFVGWQLAGEGEVIPYNVTLIDNREPTLQEREIGRALESIARECLARHAG